MRVRNNNCPVRGLMLKGKAKELHSKIKENDSGFNASDDFCFY